MGERFSISGRVIDATGRGVAAVRVEVWDADLDVDDRIASTTTGRVGRFRVEFDEAAFQDRRDRRPDVFFPVYRGERLIASTERKLVRNLSDRELDVTIQMETTETSPPGDDSESLRIGARDTGTDRRIDALHDSRANNRTTTAQTVLPVVMALATLRHATDVDGHPACRMALPGAVRR